MNSKIGGFIVTFAVLSGAFATEAAVPDATVSGPVLIINPAVSDAKTAGPVLIINPAVSDAKTAGPVLIINPAVSDAKSTGARAIAAPKTDGFDTDAAASDFGEATVQTSSGRTVLDLNAPRSNRD